MLLFTFFIKLYSIANSSIPKPIHWNAWNVQLAWKGWGSRGGQTAGHASADRQTPSLSSTLCVFGISSWTSCPIWQNQSCQLYSSHCVHFDKIWVAAVTFRTERLPHSTELSATHMNGLFVKCLRLLKMSKITTQEWRFLGATHHPNVDQIRNYVSEYVTVCGIQVSLYATQMWFP